MYLAGLLIYWFCISLTVPSHWGPRVPRFCAHGEDAQQGITKDLPSILVAWEIFGGFDGNFNGNIIFHGWWFQPPEKYESVGIIIPNTSIYGKIKNVGKPPTSFSWMVRCGAPGHEIAKLGFTNHSNFTVVYGTQITN